MADFVSRNIETVNYARTKLMLQAPPDLFDIFKAYTDSTKKKQSQSKSKLSSSPTISLSSTENYDIFPFPEIVTQIAETLEGHPESPSVRFFQFDDKTMEGYAREYYWWVKEGMDTHKKKKK